MKASEIPDRDSKANWPALRALFTYKFATKTLAEWEQIFTGTDACVAPVRSLKEYSDFRPFVGLSKTPGYAPDNKPDSSIKAGEGMTSILSNWLGWQEKQDYVVDSKGSAQYVGAKSSI